MNTLVSSIAGRARSQRVKIVGRLTGEIIELARQSGVGLVVDDERHEVCLGEELRTQRTDRPDLGDTSATLVGMTRVASRELRNDTAGVIRRAARGELIEITVNGEAVARLAALTRERSPWLAKSEFVARLSRIQADPGLADDLAALDDDTDDLGPIR
jgi:prevent-host-death family protein